MTFEVYICTVDEEIVYIGCGKIGRHNHCNSGCSHVYGLNQHHFNGVNIEVKIHNLLATKEEALIEEKRLIRLHKPKFNRAYLNDTRAELASKSAKFKASIMDVSEIPLTSGKKVRYLQLVEEFLDFYRFSDLWDGDFSIYSRTDFDRIKKFELSKLTRFLRKPSDFSVDSHYFAFQKRMKDLLGVDLSDKLC